ncbi:MAG: hypothetical protein MMC23_001299 [Stictis urceolatum]|nr:hypothetical protein [Stictis urceolata]
MVDKKGPRVGSTVGCLAMGLGYYALHKTYTNGPGSVPLPLICLFTFVAGAGGSSGFGGAIKTAAMNFPKNRGTATAFPVAAFGLSAFFFSLISSLALPNNTAGFLLFLSIGTFLMIAIPAFFMRILPHSAKYSALLSEADNRAEEHKRSRHRRRDTSTEPGTRDQSVSGPSSSEVSLLNETTRAEMPELSKLDTEDSSHAAVDTSGDEDDSHSADDAHGSVYADLRGWALLRVIEFYQLFIIIGVLTGIGLMTINNIGNNAQALWSHWDENTPAEVIHQRQSMHVSIISIASFTGRLCSGIGSDIIVERLHMSRIWCFVLSSLLFCIAQVCGLTLESPNFLFVLSTISGLGYGFLFGVGPSITADTFGPHGLSQNWGTMTLSPIIFANIYNLMYGRIYDHHSNIRPSGHRECLDGLLCYKDAYWVTFFSSIASIILCLWTIRHGRPAKQRGRKSDADERHLA